MPKIRFALNLDNIRCFLYGYGVHEIDDGSNRYSTAALRTGVPELNPTPIRNRKDFIKCHFGDAFDKLLYETYISSMDEKRKVEYITEINIHKGSRRGQEDFLKNISEMYAKGEPDFTMDKLIQRNEYVLSRWNLSQFDTEILDFIRKLRALESINDASDRKNVVVSYILERIHEIASINVCTLPSTKNSAKVLALLLLAALLWEKFPLSLLTENPFFTNEQRYHLDNLFTGLQLNLNVLNMQLNAQTSFLKHLRELSSWTGILAEHESLRNTGSIDKYYSLALWDIEKAYRMMDYTDLSEECAASGFSFDQCAIVFLHSAAYGMEGFARMGMRRALEYTTLKTKTTAISSNEISMLADAYEKCLLWYRKLVYWNIVALCRGLPYDVIKDMNQYAGFFAPDESETFSLSIRMNERDICDKIDCMERNFHQAVSTTPVEFPETFYKVGFTKEKTDPLPQKAGMAWVLSGEPDDCAEKAIIDAFLMQFKRMDRICDLHSHMLEIIFGVVDNEGCLLTVTVKDLSSVIKRHKKMLQTMSNIPPIVVRPPLASYMQEKNIKTLEFQGACAYIYELVLDSLKYINQIESAFSAEKNAPNFWITMRQYCINAQSAYDNHVAYLNTLPNYLFAGWDRKWSDYLINHTIDFQVLCVKPGQWAETQAEAERQITKVLDTMENDILGMSRIIARETWDLAMMKANIEQMLVSFPSEM